MTNYLLVLWYVGTGWVLGGSWNLDWQLRAGKLDPCTQNWAQVQSAANLTASSTGKVQTVRTVVAAYCGDKAEPTIPWMYYPPAGAQTVLVFRTADPSGECDRRKVWDAAAPKNGGGG